MSDLHVHPAGDTIGHEMTDDCPCGPEQQPAETEGGLRWLAVHHSLDGREQREASP